MNKYWRVFMEMDDKTRVELVKLIGEYLLENAENLIPIRVGDMSKETFSIVMRQKKKGENPCPTTTKRS